MKRFALVLALLLACCCGSRVVAEPPNQPNSPNPMQGLGGIAPNPVNPGANAANAPAPDPAPAYAELQQRITASDKVIAELRAAVAAGTANPETLKAVEAVRAQNDASAKIASDAMAKVAELQKAHDALASRPFPVQIGPTGPQGNDGKPIDLTLPGLLTLAMGALGWWNDRRTAKKSAADLKAAKAAAAVAVAEALRVWEELPQTASDADVREAVANVHKAMLAAA